MVDKMIGNPILKRPINGGDMLDLRNLLGLSLADVLWLTGTYGPSFTDMTNKRQLEPLMQASRSILVRFLLHYPEYTMLPKVPSFEEISTKINAALAESGAEMLDHREVAVALGMEPGSSYRLLKAAHNTSPVSDRLTTLVEHILEREGAKGLRKYLDVVEEEAKARGIPLDKLWSKGGWRASVSDKVSKRGGRANADKAEEPEGA